MARGFISGVLGGGVVVVVGLGVLSLATGPGDGPDPVTQPAGSEIAVVEPDGVTPPTAPATDEAPQTPATDDATPTDTPPETQPAESGEELPLQGGTDTRPPAVPVTEIVGADDVIVPVGEGTAPTASASQPPVPSGAGDAPEVPADEDAPRALADLALPDVATNLDPQNAAPADGDQLEMAQPADAAPATAAPAPTQPPASDENAPAVDVAPAQTPGEDVPDAEPPAPIKSAPVTQIGDLAPNVTTNRLPRIGVETETAAEDVSVEALVLDSDAPALERNAAPFDNPEGRPLMAVILKDDPASRTALGDLKNLPFPISFVVDAGAADATQAITFYRDSGAEVVVALSLPEGATPTDAEVVLQAQAAQLTNAVATLLPASFQTAGATARQVAVVMQEGGHGLISVPQGLNTGHKSVVKEGVAAGLVFRELDNDGQSAAVIRRFMDNAAFKARQEQGVIMLGHARVETVQALIEWSLGNRAKSVALAPVSAVLLDK